jgi:CRP-like cAMP-binding protein
MLITVERVLILSSVGFFADLSGELLAEISALFEEEEVLAGETILNKGEYGTTMYIIVSGSVRVHDGDHEIAVLGERDIFGELAALDPEFRTASVSALEDTILLKLEHAAFYELIFDHAVLAKNIIRFLCRRYRGTVPSGPSPD